MAPLDKNDNVTNDKTSKHGENIDRILQQDRKQALWHALGLCKGEDEIRAFLTDLCTPQELQALSERWAIARLLDEGGMSYRDISSSTGASTTTVGRVARFLQQEPHLGYRRILDRLPGKSKRSVTNDKGNNK